MKSIILLILLTNLFSQDIAFVGDSITESEYISIVEGALQNYTIHNFGVAGITVANGNYNYRNTTEYQQVLDLKSQHTVVFLGSNDVRFYKILYETWGSLWVYEYRWLIIQFKKNSKVLLCTIPYQLDTNDASLAIDRLNDKIYNIAEEFGLEVADINSALGSNPDYFIEDGIHPNADGIQIMAAEILKHFTTEYLQRDDEYWESVSNYEKQKRIGWFGCDRN